MRTSNLSVLEKAGILGGLIFGLFGFVLGIGGYISANEANKIANTANDISEKTALTNIEVATLSNSEYNKATRKISNEKDFIGKITDIKSVGIKESIIINNPSIFTVKRYNNQFTYSTYDFLNRAWSLNVTDVNYSSNKNELVYFPLIFNSNYSLSKIVKLEGNSYDGIYITKYADKEINTNEIAFAYSYVKIGQYNYDSEIYYLLISVIGNDTVTNKYYVINDYQINLKIANQMISSYKKIGEGAGVPLYSGKVYEIVQEFINVCDN